MMDQELHRKVSFLKASRGRSIVARYGCNVIGVTRQIVFISLSG